MGGILDSAPGYSYNENIDRTFARHSVTFEVLFHIANACETPNWSVEARGHRVTIMQGLTLAIRLCAFINVLAPQITVSVWYWFKSFVAVALVGTLRIFTLGSNWTKILPGF